MHVFSSTLALLAASASLLGEAAEARLVFAHYLVAILYVMCSRVYR